MVPLLPRLVWAGHSGATTTGTAPTVSTAEVLLSTRK